MFEDSHDRGIDLFAQEWPGHCLPKDHDPFGCTCCANVFREIFTAADIDLKKQVNRLSGRGLAPLPPVL